MCTKSIRLLSKNAHSDDSKMVYVVTLNGLCSECYLLSKEIGKSNKSLSVSLSAWMEGIKKSV